MLDVQKKKKNYNPSNIFFKLLFKDKITLFIHIFMYLCTHLKRKERVNFIRKQKGHSSYQKEGLKLAFEKVF